MATCFHDVSVVEGGETEKGQLQQSHPGRANPCQLLAGFLPEFP